ncbi:FHA domain-containing protein [Fibrella aquatilis]|uniref:FHA domain-containing protein n=1 Tax=Fibrella aquatilis TaxID=2817059 RepID=A0A939K129_9BACT|nr:FHA domain-containing protein [Fibrella aquatilis]MBO0931840.1 FHA domain-containing protein [Fibrella aquatilis]
MPFSDTLKRFFGMGTPPAEIPKPAAPEPVQSVPVSAQSNSPKPPPAPRKRDELFRFLVEKLTPYANEKENAPLGLRLWVRCPTPDDEQLMNVVLYAHQPGQFQAELNRHLANHYIALPPNWPFEWQYVPDVLPIEATYQRGDFGLSPIFKPVAATINPAQIGLRALVGQTAEASYLLDSTQKTEFTIGRGQTVETASGRIRTNDIVFLDGDDVGFDASRGEANLVVSRQHATIKYDATNRRFRLYADPGGLPASGNKTKILHTDDTIERADMPGMGYALSPGDQIEFGGEAKLLVEGVA